MKAISVPYGLLDGVSGGPVECHIVNDRADHHTATHELSDADVLIIPPEPVDPAHDKGVTVNGRGPRL
jgi:hypothetical protein